MKAGKRITATSAITLPIGLAVVVPAWVHQVDRHRRRVNAQAAAAGDGQFVAVAASDADYAGLKADVEAAGGSVVREMPQVGTLVVKAPKAAKARMAASIHAAARGVGPHRVHRAARRRRRPGPRTGSSRSTSRTTGPSVTPDPASSIPGLLSNQQRVNMTDAWKVTAGDPRRNRGRRRHGPRLHPLGAGPKVSAVVDFTTTGTPRSASVRGGPQRQVGR